MLIGLFYRPPNTKRLISRSVNSIDLPFNTANDNIAIPGDFNLKSSIVNSRRKLRVSM